VATRSAIFINLFYDFAPPEAVKVYQSFDASNGRTLQELRELISGMRERQLQKHRSGIGSIFSANCPSFSARPEPCRRLPQALP
jgi:hypothetical protein